MIPRIRCRHSTYLRPEKTTSNKQFSFIETTAEAKVQAKLRTSLLTLLEEMKT